MSYISYTSIHWYHNNRVSCGSLYGEVSTNKDNVTCPICKRNMKWTESMSEHIPKYGHNDAPYTRPKGEIEQ
jgi:hypothetical protein